MSAPPPYTLANVAPHAKFSLKAKEAINEDMTGAGGRADDFNAKSEYVSQKQGASA